MHLLGAKKLLLTAFAYRRYGACLPLAPKNLSKAEVARPASSLKLLPLAAAKGAEDDQPEQVA